jgi:hypothetical protein
MRSATFVDPTDDAKLALVSFFAYNVVRSAIPPAN